ncbi:hypothetical protein D9613_001510 [Agrocybe pediades]|uniref:Uncharacterized protein n=1 Tax=Agrocybe pediades TaxID=84607 RepID=A0A8H4R593_9AGAR|nr:hypothetical protein D9613_001510 [Agrocybe pediades]
MLKLAFTEVQKKGLRNEYCIYSHMAAKLIEEGIFGVHGLFTDPESGALALLMDHGGESLLSTTPSVTQKDAFKRILENLHEIGILTVIFDPTTCSSVQMDPSSSSTLTGAWTSTAGVHVRTSKANGKPSKPALLENILTKRIIISNCITRYYYYPLHRCEV